MREPFLPRVTMPNSHKEDRSSWQLANLSFLNKNSTYDVPQIIYKKYYAEMKYYDWLNKTV